MRTINHPILRETPRASKDERHRREGYTIIIASGLWRSVEVFVEPPTSTHPMRSFKTHAQATVYADELSRVESWPIVDRTGGAA